MDTIDFWRLRMRQRILQKGDEILKNLRARRGGARLGQPQNHARGGSWSYKRGHRKVKVILMPA